MPITCKREGDEVVVRIPADLETRVLITLENEVAPGFFAGGWVVHSGTTTHETPLVQVHPRSKEQWLQALLNGGPGQSKGSAS